MTRSTLGLLGLFLVACGGGSSSSGGGGGGGGDPLSGACASATVHDAPFSVTTTADAATSGLALSCSTETDVGQAAHAIELAQAAMVHITAKDESGQGVGVEVRTAACDGATGCVWQSNGNVDEMVNLDAGTWVIVVQRKPAGKYTLAASW